MAGRLIVISNRIPSEAAPSGGLVYALHETLRKIGGIWIGSHPETTENPSESLSEYGDQGKYTRLSFSLSPEDYKNFYLGFSNSVLWPVCHRRGDLVELDRGFERGYSAVNARLARQVMKVARPDDMIWVHDYHFFPLATELRKLGFADDMAGDIVIGVDRLDYSKGLPNRFRAFGRYLETRDERERRVSMVQIAPPSREEVAAYRELRYELEELVGRVNGEHGEIDWTPLRYIHRNLDRDLLARLYRRARVGIVTPFADGMNLVAKEYVAAQDPEDPGVLILSHMAGAAEDLTDAIQVNPYDIEDMSEALKTALALPLEERKRRHASCMAQVRATDVNRWSQNFVEALQACLPTLVTKPAAREWTDA